MSQQLKFPLIDKIFGKWKVISRDYSLRSDTCYKCVCECGIEKTVRSKDLRYGKSTSCFKCRTLKIKKCRIFKKQSLSPIDIKENIKKKYDMFVIRNGNKCWGWNGCCPKNPGYGQFRANGKLIRAHKASWIIYNGPIPEGLYVCHKCDNRICSNPEHLFLGTMYDNIKDCIDKGRHPYFGKSGEDNHRAKLTLKDVNKIRDFLKRKTMFQKTIAKMFNVTPATISAINTHKIWGTL